MNEIWVDVPGYSGLYQVSNCGQVRYSAPVQSDGRRRPAGSIVPYWHSSRGYLQVSLRKNGKNKTYYVHRLVMEAFVGECPEGEQINHINGNKTDNRTENLEYCTPSENHHHAYNSLGKIAKHGEEHGGARLTDEKVRKILELRASGLTATQLASMFGVGESTVYHVLHGDTWRHVESAPDSLK